MVDSIISKVTGRLKFLYRYSRFFNQKLRKDLCSALLQCQLDYCSAAWFTGLTKTYQRKLQIFQNKMIRFILELTPREHVGQDHFNSVKLLDSQNRAKQLCLNHMLNIFHQQGPSYLHQFFTRTSDVHRHATRASSMNFHVPRVKGITAHSFFYHATLDWNCLPVNIKSIQNKSAFKTAMKSHLFRSAMTHELAEFV